MRTVLGSIKQIFNRNLDEALNDKQLFFIECEQRLGKQFISMIVSSILIKTQRFGTNRDISSALKKFEDQLIRRMGFNNKRQVYRIFGRYFLENLEMMKDQKFLELEMSRIFFKQLDAVTQPKLQPSMSVPPCQKSFIRQANLFKANQITITPSQQSGMSTNQSDATKTKIEARAQSSMVRLLKDVQEVCKISDKLRSEQQENPFKNNLKWKKSLEILKNSQERQVKPQTPNDPDEDDFRFELTEKDLEKKKQDFSCEDYFINIVGYLLKLNSPQGELTYIWQHLKWGGFETFYEPFMNQALQWTCTARIIFPQNFANQKFRERTQKSKNKKKARQLACFDLLKTLYLEYPEVWTLYKHLKQEKRLVIAAVDEPKDEDEIALIKNRQNYVINKNKVEMVFRHNKNDIRTMMEKISAKAQLNTLLQQLPGRVTSPKLQKKAVQGQWSVPVRIEYKTYDDVVNSRKPKIYEKTVVFHNTKVAEEEAYMQAIIEMYQQNPELFEKIQSIKLAKKIQDAEKKLPLLRDAKLQLKH